MAYALAWIVYLLMAALMVLAFERYVAGHVPRQPRLFIRALLAVVLFTPGWVSVETVYMVPACIAVLFNLLAKSGSGLLKAALPLLTMSSVVFGVLLFLEVRRSPETERPGN
jgi:hypothetical protein